MEIATKLAPIALALIMLGLGTSLSIQDFTRVIKIPKDFLVGFICQIIVLPIVALSIVLLLNLPVEIAVGLMLIACAPGGVTSNVITKFADGDVALSITLTAIVSLLSIISVPFIMINTIDFFNLNFVKEISMSSISLKMFFVVTLPVILGMILRRFAKNFIEKQTSLIQKISVLLFILVFISIYIEEWNNIITYMKKAGLVALILNLTMMIIGFYVAKFFASGISQQRCISIECGLQNGTLALVVGMQIFGESINTYIIPTAAYALIMMLTSIIFLIYLKKKFK
ncbi:MAG: symporter [Candidatus Pelagibacter sp.]|nr:symporter [Candidatus Pelagibacter sp.]|tara:strand:+ start:761 stop:1615 length:855 start_codon:yes stop_codon:yes gene_type:complete